MCVKSLLRISIFANEIKLAPSKHTTCIIPEMYLCAKRAQGKQLQVALQCKPSWHALKALHKESGNREPLDDLIISNANRKVEMDGGMVKWVYV
ncbi:hypothetical protein M514_06752 [Trichuris suis]|uniref:Uncharacterized protein n=1 Tax=Trichuris suis TaxID=68888 RepID=A0A085NKF7_9BILA|nr:hypothetical protein M513_06752 [Trichuris suis]KFD69953.1 hypothetical protein M514_06752 [Trichuris suis]